MTVILFVVSIRDTVLFINAKLSYHFDWLVTSAFTNMCAFSLFLFRPSPAGNTEKCSQDDNAIYCYCCYYSFIGMICPCYIAIPKGNN